MELPLDLHSELPLEPHFSTISKLKIAVHIIIATETKA